MYEEKHSSGAILFKKDPTEKAVDYLLEVVKEMQNQISNLENRCNTLEKLIRIK